MSLQQLIYVLMIFFPLSELGMAVLKRARGGGATPEDGGSMRLLWIVIGVAVALAFMSSGYAPTRLHLPPTIHVTVACVLLAGGLALRWWAILTLGRFFTTNIAIHDDHHVVDSGPYRLVRHPSYTGLLLAFAGMGVALQNGLSLALLLVLITPALLRRVRMEEAALLRGLGAPYLDYCRRTRRLVPGVY